MTMPRLFAVGLWLVATLISTTIVWTATSTVAADVTDRPAPVLPRREVVSQLATVPSTATTTSTTKPPGTTTTTTRISRTTVARNAPTTAPAPAPPTTRPATTATTVAAPPPSTTTSTTKASGPTATYPTAGGVVRVVCDGLFIHLLSATPADGWSVVVVSGGPLAVEVHFLRPVQVATVRAVCFGQPIRYFGP